MFKESLEGDPLALDRNRTNTHLHKLTTPREKTLLTMSHLELQEWCGNSLLWLLFWH